MLDKSPVSINIGDIFSFLGVKHMMRKILNETLPMSTNNI